MANKGTLVASCLSLGEMPTTGLTEMAFMGRSNAGKSSLINRLVEAKIAHTSSTPGRTQRINFFQMPGWYIVDLPGFGYARVSKTARERFGQATEQYLMTRRPLVGGFLIQDVRRDPEEDERMVVEWALQRNVYLVVVASKMDKLNRAEQQARQERLDRLYGREVLLVSNRTGEGMGRVKDALRQVGLSV